MAALAPALVWFASSSARDYVPRDLGPWTVSGSSDGKGCFITRTYRGPGQTTLLLGLDADGSNRLTILNANWSIRRKDRLRLNFRLSNAAFPRHLAVGIASDGKQGFVTSFGESFPATFAASAFLDVMRGDIPVEAVTLEGSGVAVAELRRCVALHRGSPAAAVTGKERAGGIPIDPFAPDTARRQRK